MKILKQQVNISKKLANAKTTKKEKKVIEQENILKERNKNIKKDYEKSNKSRK